MPTQAEIKKVRSLKDKKFRDALSLFVVEGEKMVSEALESGFQIEALYRRSEIGETAMSRMSLLSTPSDALALVRMPRRDKDLPLRDGGLYLALDSLRDPGNMGTIIRLADWYGLDGIFASSDSVDIYNPKVVQSTMGAIFRVRVSYCDIACLRESGARIFGTFLSGDNIYESELDYSGPRIIVVGNESNGISERIAALCDRRLTIPSFASGRGSESLNVAIATAIAVSEFRRR